MTTTTNRRIKNRYKKDSFFNISTRPANLKVRKPELPGGWIVFALLQPLVAGGPINGTCSRITCTNTRAPNA